MASIRGPEVATILEAPADVDASEYTLVRNPTNLVSFGIRALQADPAEADAMLNQFGISSYAQRADPPERR